MKLVAFTLSMPGVASWNNQWTGEGRLYVRVKRLSDKIAATLKDYYRYSFGDGWAAAVRTEEVDAKTATKLRRKTAGFAGYDWMVDSILAHGDIRVYTQSGKLYRKGS